MASAIGRSIASSLVTMSGSHYIEATLSVATSATALTLGTVTSPGYFFCKNTDSTNFVRFRNGSGGANVAKLLAGEYCLFRWDSAATPYAIADTVAVIVEYLLLSA